MTEFNELMNTELVYPADYLGKPTPEEVAALRPVLAALYEPVVNADIIIATETRTGEEFLMFGRDWLEAKPIKCGVPVIYGINIDNIHDAVEVLAFIAFVHGARVIRDFYEFCSVWTPWMNALASKPSELRSYRASQATNATN